MVGTSRHPRSISPCGIRAGNAIGERIQGNRMSAGFQRQPRCKANVTSCGVGNMSSIRFNAD